MVARLNSLLRCVARPSHAVAHVRCVLDNFGDAMVYMAIQEMLPSLTLYEYSQPSRLRGKILHRTMRIPGVCRYSSLGGGTLIFAPRKFGWLQSLESALAQTRPLFSFGTGVRDPAFNLDAGIPSGFCEEIEAWAACLRRFPFVSVRGVESKRLLGEHGIDNVEVIGDPALYYTRDRISEKRMQKTIGINVSRYGTFWSGSKEQSLSVMAAVLQALVADRWSITLFSSMPEDEPLLESMAEKSGGNEVRIFKEHADIPRTLAAIEALDVFVGFKLHLVIAACCVNTPPVMIGYQPKAIDFMKTIDFDENLIHTYEITAEKVLARIYESYERCEETQRRLHGRCRALRDRMLDFAARVEAAVSSAADN
jgi:Polysaccharide pyruvyl transferase